MKSNEPRSNHCMTTSILNALEVKCPFIDVFGDVDQSSEGAARYPSRKIMHFRADHDGYRWHNTIWPHHGELATLEMKREIDATYDAITARDALADLPALTKFCHTHMDACVDAESKTEFSFYLRGKLCDYWLRLITRPKDYNMYLSAYARDTKESDK